MPEIRFDEIFLKCAATLSGRAYQSAQVEVSLRYKSV
jgi:hypothetical protein